MPTTWPRPLTRAPPELPGEMAASVWMRSTSERMPCSAEPGISRCRPEMMPAVMVFWNPSGLPIATASSPTAGSCCWKVAGWRSLRSTSTTARSVSGSVARTRPSARRPSKKATSTVRTFPTTWALVTTTPSLDQTTPLPVPWSWEMVTHRRLDLADDPGDVPGRGGLGAGAGRGRGHRGRGRAGLRLPGEGAAGEDGGEQDGDGDAGGGAGGHRSVSSSGGANRWLGCHPGPHQNPTGPVLQPVGLQQPQPDLADGRERRHGVPQPLQGDLAGHGHRGRVEQLLDPGTGEGGPDHHPAGLVDD